MRPVEPRNLDHDSRVIFSNLMEAMSLGICDASTWLQAYRERITVVNHVVSSPKCEEVHSELKSVVASLKAIIGGQGWRVQRSLRFTLPSKYWSTAISDWKAVSGTGLTGRTMKVLKLQAANPFIALHQLTDTSSQSLVTGRDILQVPAHGKLARTAALPTSTARTCWTTSSGTMRLIRRNGTRRWPCWLALCRGARRGLSRRPRRGPERSRCPRVPALRRSAGRRRRRHDLERLGLQHGVGQ